MKRLVFKNNEAVANHSGAMEADTIKKNGHRSKSHRSRVNFWKFLAALCFIAVTNSFFVQGQSPSIAQSDSPLKQGGFANTIRQDGKPLNRTQVREVMSTNSLALEQFNKGLSYQNGSYVGAAIALIGVIWLRSDSQNIAPYILIPIGFGIGIPATIVGGALISSSVKTYNSGLRNDTSYQIYFGISPTGGVGLTMRF